MANRKIGSDLTTGSVAGALLRFCAPFFLANLLQTMYGLVDTVIIGQFVGTNAQSAVSTCSELVTMYTYLASGFSSAGQTMIGQFVGAKNTDRVSRTIGTLFTSLMTIAVLCSVMCFFTWRIQLNLISLPSEAMTDGRNYFLICSAGMVFIFGYNMVSAVLRGMGDSKRPLIFVAITSVVNLLLDLVFIVIFGMGAAGAALATVIGQAISFIVSLIYLYRHRDRLGFAIHKSDFGFDKTLTTTLFRLGIPMAAQGVLIWCSMLYICAKVNTYGVAASAANGIAMKLNNVVRIASNSVMMAATAMIAQCIGAGKLDRVRKVFWLSGGYIMIASVICAAAILLFPEQIFGLFNSDPDVIAYASVYCIFGAIDYIGCALRSPFNGMIDGTGAALLGMITGIIDGIVARIGLAFFFGSFLGMGLTGYWLGNSLAGFAPVVVGAPYYFSGAWKRKRLIKEDA